MVLICLVAFFAIVTGVNAVMIALAVSTFGGVETASSYQAGLAFAREIAAAQAQDARSWRVRAGIGPAADGRRIELEARDAAGLPVTNVAASVTLAHPTDRREDRAVVMSEVAPGRFVGTAAVAAGQWDLVIELDRNAERMFRSKSRVILR
jgi:nitrogen fixation protein FixH